MSVYLDVIWLLNLCFDSLLLWLTAIMLKRNIVFWRIIAGAFIGSLLVLFMFTPFSLYAQQPFIKLLFSFFIVYTAFGFKRFRYFLENVFTFYFATFMVGGGLIAIHYFLQNEVHVSSGVMTTYSMGAGDPVSWLFVLVGFPILWFFSRKRIEGIREKKLRFDSIVDVLLTFDGTHIPLKGLIDSGNQLYDPMTKTPVMIVEIDKVKAIFPERLLTMMSARNFAWLDDEYLGKWSCRLRLIPYRAVGKEQQFLVAVRPDRIMICYENEWIEVQKGLVGLNEASLSADGEYQCIVHPKMVQTGKRLTAS
ncbi:sigma-E processing peptidase SpoIIGA [Thermaerobacillus caldiproteolyticus]|uniref:Sporulation sigma-E factor-processing peptidase n=1 Tax=Thermaerobacillus caldiproteolyticus TaxID=247480 RepID=A0A7W0BXZ1_9BACL|nr:sigma-E processing peptidase SpoIIGA [Anoxybacillus caldiproteolyticus]MBA2874075.1 stage II sporulation protein GA (sporulation sigma-E factor processing peptidase) [Anoxybacillus caldiproteolyticus]